MKTIAPLPVVCFGEILWDILPTGAQPGGAPMNVAYHLNKLGAAPALITRIGLDEYGKQLVNILSGCGITTDFFDIDYEHPTGLVYADTNNHHDVTYDIVYPSAWDFIEWKEEYDTLVSDATYFVFGSLTSRSRISRNTLGELLEAAQTRVLDINLRPPHFHRPGIEYLLRQADILKMNLAELELVTGWFSNYHSVEERISAIQERFQIPTIIVTKGGEGATVADNGTFYNHPGYDIKVADTIGSGDAFLAGFLSQLLHGHPLAKALEFASAMGAFIATRSGACPAYEVSAVQTLIHSTQSPIIHPIFQN